MHSIADTVIKKIFRDSEKVAYTLDRHHNHSERFLRIHITDQRPHGHTEDIKIFLTRTDSWLTVDLVTGQIYEGEEHLEEQIIRGEKLKTWGQIPLSNQASS